MRRSLAVLSVLALALLVPGMTMATTMSLSFANSYAVEGTHIGDEGQVIAQYGSGQPNYLQAQAHGTQWLDPLSIPQTVSLRQGTIASGSFQYAGITGGSLNWSVTGTYSRANSTGIELVDLVIFDHHVFAELFDETSATIVDAADIGQTEVQCGAVIIKVGASGCDHLASDAYPPTLNHTTSGAGLVNGHYYDITVGVSTKITAVGYPIIGMDATTTAQGLTASASWTPYVPATPTPTPKPVTGKLGDFNGDGQADAVARDSAGYLWLLPHSPSSGWGSRVQIGNGWNGMTAILTADFNGDGNTDVISRDSSGYLWLYPHTPSGFGARSQIGNGWSGMTALMAADFTGDGNADIIARNGAGNLMLYPHRPSGFSSPYQIGNGWSAMTALVAADFTGDGNADIIARDGAGALWLYPHTPSGFGAKSQIGQGWGSFAYLYAADFTGDGNADMVACSSSGVIYLYPHAPSGWGSSSSYDPGLGSCTALL